MRRGAGLAALLVIAGCASTDLAPRTGAQAPLADQDEQGLWRQAEEAQRDIDGSGRLQADPALEAYLGDVARRLEPPEVLAAIPFRVRVVRERTPNAFCFPNGGIYVTTGILAALESEAELAALLGHEMTHAVGRHAVRHLHESENAGAVLNSLGSWLGAPAHRGGVFYAAAVAGYGRDLEREADREGLARMAAAGYDPRQAAGLYERLLAWTTAENVRDGASSYASHPQLSERIENARALAAALPPGGEVGREVYLERTAEAAAAAVRTELAAGRSDAARRLADRYAALRPGDARGHLLLGELARREGSAEADARAAASYRRAVELDAGLAEAWRGLGLVLRRRGDAAGAREALTRYLALAPQAPDRAQIAALVDTAAPPGGKP